jgi:hypothetical protein
MLFWIWGFDAAPASSTVPKAMEDFIVNNE